MKDASLPLGVADVTPGREVCLVPFVVLVPQLHSTLVTWLPVASAASFCHNIVTCQSARALLSFVFMRRTSGEPLVSRREKPRIP